MLMESRSMIMTLTLVLQLESSSDRLCFGASFSRGNFKLSNERERKTRVSVVINDSSNSFVTCRLLTMPGRGLLVKYDRTVGFAFVLN